MSGGCGHMLHTCFTHAVATNMPLVGLMIVCAASQGGKRPALPKAAKLFFSRMLHLSLLFLHSDSTMSCQQLLSNSCGSSPCSVLWREVVTSFFPTFASSTSQIGFHLGNCTLWKSVLRQYSALVAGEGSAFLTPKPLQTTDFSFYISQATGAGLSLTLLITPNQAPISRNSKVVLVKKILHTLTSSH